MSTTTDERGILNNFASEPAVYFAQPPAPSEQRRYLLQGIAAIAFLSGVLSIALAVS